MGLNSSVWLLFLAVIFRGVSGDVSLDEGVDEFTEYASVKEGNIRRTHGDTVKQPVPAPLERKSHPSRRPWTPSPANQHAGVKPLSSHAENPRDSSRSGIKALPSGPQKSILRTALHGMGREPTHKNEKLLQEHKPFISSYPSSSTTEKVSLEDRPTRKEEGPMLILKVKTSHVSQLSVGKISSGGTSQKQSQEMGQMGSKETIRESTPIPKSVTPEVSKNKTGAAKEEAKPPLDDDLVLFSLIDVPERDETTTCGPGERWHNNRCRTAIR